VLKPPENTMITCTLANMLIHVKFIVSEILSTHQACCYSKWHNANSTRL